MPICHGLKAEDHLKDFLLNGVSCCKHGYSCLRKTIFFGSLWDDNKFQLTILIPNLVNPSKTWLNSPLKTNQHGIGRKK